jgi:hypothetical protein
VSGRRGVLAAVLSAGVAAFAQEAGAPPSAREGDTVSWYVVQPGDTLEKITEKLLGSSSLWPENWRLNPGVRDPELLRVGLRLRVITHRVLPQRTATVTKVARQVEEKPHPGPWVPARVGSVLKEKDGVRTYERSSAELAFDDGSLLTLTEDSLVFLREVGSTVTGVRRQSLEIVEGQADLESRPRQPRRSEIEIVVGQARLKPEADATRTAQARARRVESGGAQVMVYAGRGDVESGGATVSVPAGMGTSVPEAGAPRPPEKLLGVPRLESPRPRTEWDFANPPFAWGTVAGAAFYTLEICADPSCGQLLQRITGLREPTWTPPQALRRGEIFWRVTGVAASGLDGFPSPASPFTIRSDRIDSEPPVIAVRVDGPCAPGVEGTVLLGRGARLLVEARDDAAGVDALHGRWDGGSWRPLAQAPLEPPPDEKTHLLEVRAVDRRGRQAPILRLAVRRSLSPPAPPLVQGEPGRSHPPEIR